MIGKCHGGPLDGQTIEVHGVEFLTPVDDLTQPDWTAEDIGKTIEVAKYRWDWSTGAFYCVGTS